MVLKYMVLLQDFLYRKCTDEIELKYILCWIHHNAKGLRKNVKSVPMI